MPGHGSPPDPDLSSHPGRSVTRDSGLSKVSFDAGPVAHEVTEYRPPPGTKAKVSENGTRFSWRAYVGENQVTGDRRAANTAKRAATKAGNRISPKI